MGLNDEVLFPPDISLHLSTDKPTIKIKGHINKDSSKANWISLAIGGLVLTLYTPTQVGVKDIMSKFNTPWELSGDSILVKTKPSTVSIPVEITSYNADPAQTDSTPTITASGATVAEDICALSRDIEKEFGLKFGDLVYI